MWWDKPGKAKPQGEPRALPFMRMRFAGFLITALVLVATTVSLATRGLNLGLDFTGGVLIEAAREEPFDFSQVRSQINDLGYQESQVTESDGGRIAIIRLAVGTTGEDVEAVTRDVTAALGAGVEIRKTDAVGPKVSGELLRSGILASLLAVAAIGAYIWFRFESKFGWAAFLTTFHDVYAVLGLFSITQMTFDLTIVAGVLTVAGYSINDTVVVFDRIREMLRKFKKLPLPTIIDVAITSTLTRTLITSIATLLAAGSMMVLGGPVLIGLAVSIAFGILIGTYSSIFVAAPMLMHLPGRVPGSRVGQPEEGAAATS
jgi:preprotein translocase subunit SecF